MALNIVRLEVRRWDPHNSCTALPLPLCLLLQQKFKIALDIHENQTKPNEANISHPEMRSRGGMMYANLTLTLQSRTVDSMTTLASEKCVKGRKTDMLNSKS